MGWGPPGAAAGRCVTMVRLAMPHNVLYVRRQYNVMRA